MSEIEKMYKLAQIANEGYDAWDAKDIYPPFTAEKQINLILCLSKRGIKFNCHSISSGYLLSKNKRKTSMRAGYKADNFPDLLAQHINYIWQDLTPEEKQQVKGILE